MRTRNTMRPDLSIFVSESYSNHRLQNAQHNADKTKQHRHTRTRTHIAKLEDGLIFHFDIFSIFTGLVHQAHTQRHLSVCVLVDLSKINNRPPPDNMFVFIDHGCTQRNTLISAAFVFVPAARRLFHHFQPISAVTQHNQQSRNSRGAYTTIKCAETVGKMAGCLCVCACESADGGGQLKRSKNDLPSCALVSSVMRIFICAQPLVPVLCVWLC